MTKKLKVGFYGITGCAGCLLSVIFNENEILGVADKIDIVSFPFIKERQTDEPLDVIFLEGVVANNHDLETLKKLRAQTKVLVAMGACATTGGTPALRNFQDPHNFETLQYHKAIGIADIPPQPVDKFVHVDYYIEGCPPDKKEILGVINDFVLGKEPFMYSKPVCVECRKNKNPCLLEMGQPCLGPVTRGGCNAVCTNNGLVCWGCRGPASETDVTFKEMVSLLKVKGFDEKFTRDRLNTFAGWEHKEMEETGKNEPHS
ncbi:MAG: hypothetical protein AABX51_07875 [Nanoarchaeota archaeon]